ncbi:MAG: AAA family ATPase [Alloprevotella sp.]
MKIEKITLCNLTSIEGEQVIDFTQEPLRSAGLFAITGDTGAGKSTILDAVCLALYDRAPRFEGMEKLSTDSLKRQEDRAQAMQAGDVRAMLRRGCKEGYATVVFATPDGARYEAGWQLRVKRTGTYEKETRTLRQLSPHKETVPEGEIARRITEIIGLDYTQFTRTVMLAQNSFATFLRAKKSEKSALLEKLTGTEIYGLVSQKIYSLTAEATQKADNLQHIIAGILHDRLNDDELNKLHEEQALTTSTAATIEERQALVARQLDWFNAFEAATREVATCESRFAAVNKQCAALRADQLALARHDEVLGVQPLYQEIIMRRQDIDACKRAEEQAAGEIEAVKTRIEQARRDHTLALDAAAEAATQLTLRRPAISRGHVLSGELGQLETQLKTAGEQTKTADLMLTERTGRVKAKKERLDELTAQLETTSLHRQALSVHRLMFEKFDLIKDKLIALNEQTRLNAESHKKFAELGKRQTELKSSSEKIEKQQNDNEDKMNTLKSELFIHRQSNQGRDSAQLQQRFADNRNRLLSLQRAKALWARISEGYELIEEKRDEVSRLNVSLNQLHNDAEKAEKALLVTEETFKRMNVALTLSQSENIVRLRKQLKEGTACPVCGATHHPYHTETERELGELLNNLEKEFNDTSAELKDKRATLEAINRQMAETDGRLTAEKANLEAYEKRQRADVDEWQACAALDASFADCSPTVARETRKLMIDLLIDNTSHTAEEAEKELQTFNFHQGHINRLNEQIATLEAEMANNRARLDDLRTQRRIAAVAAEETERIMTLSDRSCGELYTDLDEMVTLSGWFTEWKNNPDGFRLRLSDLHTDWTKTTKAIDTMQRSEALMREELKAEEAGLAEAHQHLGDATDRENAIREKLKDKREELKSLFGDTTPEQEESRLQAQIAKANAYEVETRQTYDKAAGQLSTLEGKQQTLQTNRLQSQEEYRTKMAQLDLWILKFNADHSPMQFSELESIFSDSRDWNALRQRLDALKEQRTLAEKALEAARHDLLLLQSRPDRPSQTGAETREALNETATQLDAKRRQAAERLMAISLRLQQHDSCLAQAAQYDEALKAANNDAEEWKRLNDLLGSADGRKFRELAQSYTFGFLVEQANCHLKQLTPRYELCPIPGTLTLEIIDRDMFDEHRYVSSLSGGETFVVSLAMALGLASLSSQNLNIGSLFIDEGFGNLDRASLDLVMLALSNLETHQGRKVGVISHTDQIRSQISPQIRLVRLPGEGRSRIEVG